jgi:hypothetical protein
VHDNPLLAAAFILSTENLSTRIIIAAFKSFIDFSYPLAGFAALSLLLRAHYTTATKDLLL